MNKDAISKYFNLGIGNVNFLARQNCAEDVVSYIYLLFCQSDIIFKKTKLKIFVFQEMIAHINILMAY